jgi:hypothetical protein
MAGACLAVACTGVEGCSGQSIGMQWVKEQKERCFKAVKQLHCNISMYRGIAARMTRLIGEAVVSCRRGRVLCCSRAIVADLYQCLFACTWRAQGDVAGRAAVTCCIPDRMQQLSVTAVTGAREQGCNCHAAAVQQTYMFVVCAFDWRGRILAEHTVHLLSGCSA